MGHYPSSVHSSRLLQINAYALYDAKRRKPDEDTVLKASYRVAYQTTYAGAEKLLIEEIPMARLWELLVEVRESGEKPGLVPPGNVPVAEAVKTLAYSLLKNEKGSGYAARLVSLCNATELPATVVEFMKRVYADFPKPETVAVPPKAEPTPDEK